MQWRIILFSGFLIISGVHKANSEQQHFDKVGFYKVMATGDTDAINKEILIVQESSADNKDGYEGALLMKKADFLVAAKKKLKIFKAGCIKLETALQADSNNTEFRFLRLSIQEHAPKAVKYHCDLEKDKLFIQKNFKSLSAVVQSAILDYCKKSNFLHVDPSVRD